MGFKDLIITYLYSGGGMLAVYKSLLGFSSCCLPQFNGNTPTNFSVCLSFFFLNAFFSSLYTKISEQYKYICGVC